MPVQPTSAARQRRCSGRGVFNSPTPNTGAACLDRGAQARRAPTVPVGLSPGRGGGAGWRAAGTASAPFVTSEQLSLRHRLQQATRRARQRHSANDDASRPRGRRLPFAHLSSASTDRTRKRASPIFVARILIPWQDVKTLPAAWIAPRWPYCSLLCGFAPAPSLSIVQLVARGRCEKNLCELA